MQIERFSIETSGPNDLSAFVPRAPKAEAQRNQPFSRHFLLRMVVVFLRGSVVSWGFATVGFIGSGCKFKPAGSVLCP